MTINRRKIKFFVPFLVLVLGFLINKILAKTAPSIEMQEDTQVVKYFVEPVARESFSTVVRSHGQVNARAEISLVAQVSGEVVSFTLNSTREVL